jgi:hypothetical protein
VTATSDYLAGWCQSCGGLIGPRAGACTCDADHSAELLDDRDLEDLAQPE